MAGLGKNNVGAIHPYVSDSQLNGFHPTASDASCLNLGRWEVAIKKVSTSQSPLKNGGIMNIPHVKVAALFQ